MLVTLETTMHSGSTVMTTFSSKPPQCSSRRSCHVHIGAAAASPPPLIRRCPSVSWRWRLRRHTCRLQCGQQSPQQNSNLVDEDDSRLSQNAGIFHPSIWGDFFLGYSNPAAASSQQQVIYLFTYPRSSTLLCKPTQLTMISIY